MRRRLLSRFLLLALAITTLLAATACSEVTSSHWRRNGGYEYELWVVIPEENPHSADNDGNADFVGAIEEAVYQWDQHPDVTVELLKVADDPENPYQDFCKLNHSSPNTDYNCIEAWEVPTTHMASAHGGAAGVTVVWGNSTQRFNGPLNDPSRIELVDDWSSQGANAVPALYNAACHELGHALGLAHADMVDLDEDPQTGVNGAEYQPPGPCQDAVPDRDEEAPYDGELGWDWENVDYMYDTCVNDSTGPPGSPSINPNGNNNVDTIGYDDCGEFFFNTESNESQDDVTYDELDLEPIITTDPYPSS